MIEEFGILNIKMVIFYEKYKNQSHNPSEKQVQVDQHQFYEDLNKVIFISYNKIYHILYMKSIKPWLIAPKTQFGDTYTNHYII